MKDRLWERVVVYQGHYQVTTGDGGGNGGSNATDLMYCRPPIVHG